uniref:Uncharacterized protein n=1 Tax=Utricularia reniformis TaxID=192314 RepID=A0A1Y0B1X7_9LAMI|nr:hypothetical protein AEK19_MT1187 [Utricularia reniformis]ART31400.1 hypothetical protein AEK19_MT1187 [Utricularia reniformis]
MLHLETALLKDYSSRRFGTVPEIPSWLKLGDRSTRFLHATTLCRRKKKAPRIDRGLDHSMEPLWTTALCLPLSMPSSTASAGGLSR